MLMRGRLGTLALVASVGLACAARADLNKLDALSREREPEWEYIRGTACNFNMTDAICVSAVDIGRDVDVTLDVMRGLATEFPIAGNSCGSLDRRIVVEYTGQYAGCTHCPPPYMDARVGSASVQVYTPQGATAQAVWTDWRGGTAADVAYRFGQGFAKMLKEASSACIGLAANP
jgi:hypothetical protein